MAYSQPRSRLGPFCALLALVLLMAGGVAATRERQGDQAVRRITLPAASAAVGGAPLRAPPPDQPFNVLVVGSDERPANVQDGVSGRRSDTIAIVRVDAPARTLSVLSVPRDLWLPIADTGGQGKVNSAFSSGGPDRLIRTVTDALGVSIHRYLEIDFTAFEAVVGLVGGVSIPFEGPARDRGSGFAVASGGLVRLDGPAALRYVRARNIEVLQQDEWIPDRTGDLGRIRRQQDFLRRLAAVVRDRSKADPGALDKLLAVLGPHLTIDRGFPAVELLRLADTYIDVDPGSLPMATLPTKPDRVAGQSILRLSRDAAAPLLKPFVGP